jgi:hypothetical protein
VLVRLDHHREAVRTHPHQRFLFHDPVLVRTVIGKIARIAVGRIDRVQLPGPFVRVHQHCVRLVLAPALPALGAIPAGIGIVELRCLPIESEYGPAFRIRFRIVTCLDDTESAGRRGRNNITVPTAISSVPLALALTEEMSGSAGIGGRRG